MPEAEDDLAMDGTRPSVTSRGLFFVRKVALSGYVRHIMRKHQFERMKTGIIGCGKTGTGMERRLLSVQQQVICFDPDTHCTCIHPLENNANR